MNLPVKWSANKVRAIEYMVGCPNATLQEVAEESGVTRNSISLWLKDSEFVEVLYQKYMVSFGGKLPSVLNAMVKEAESGNVQAGRLVLEHSGKLIKRVEVNNFQSPFEKFLKNDDKEVQADYDVEDADFVVLPQRPVVEKKEKPPTKAEQLRSITKREKSLAKRREADKWRRRALKVNVPLMPSGRKTKTETAEWHEKIIEAESKI